MPAILVIDNNPLARGGAEVVLQSKGLGVFAGLRVFETFNFDAIIAESFAPDLDDFAKLRHVITVKPGVMRNVASDHNILFPDARPSDFSNRVVALARSCRRKPFQTADLGESLRVCRCADAPLFADLIGASDEAARTPRRHDKQTTEGCRFRFDARLSRLGPAQRVRPSLNPSQHLTFAGVLA